MPGAKRARTPLATSTREKEKMVTSTKLVGKNVLTTLCAMCSWARETVLKSEVVKYKNRQHKRHAEFVAKHAAHDHEGETRMPDSMAALWPVTRDGRLHHRCHRCQNVTSTACRTSNDHERQQQRHAEKVEAHECRHGIPVPTKRALPVIGLMHDDALNRYSTEAQRRLNRLAPNGRVS